MRVVAVIALRVECDRCPRHFFVPGHDLRPMASVNLGLDRAAFLLDPDPVTLPQGWAVADGPEGGVELLCADHAPEPPA